MKILKRIFIDGLSGMAIGLFATLIIGTILEQTGTIKGGDIGNVNRIFFNIFHLNDLEQA